MARLARMLALARIAPTFLLTVILTGVGFAIGDTARELAPFAALGLLLAPMLFQARVLRKIDLGFRWPGALVAVFVLLLVWLLLGELLTFVSEG